MATTDFIYEFDEFKRLLFGHGLRGFTRIYGFVKTAFEATFYTNLCGFLDLMTQV
jgi:hypothetical protein